MVAETHAEEVEAEVIETDRTELSEYEGRSYQVATHQGGQGATLLQVIERVALNPDVDIERMQALLEMRAKEEDRQRSIAREDAAELAKREFLTAFSKVQAEIGPIFRSQENTHTRSRYADLADIDRIVTPILTKYGFSTTIEPLPCETEGHIRVRLILGHSGGHERFYEDDFQLDGAGTQGKQNKTGVQAKGSTKTYARRYLKADALDLTFTDDNDGNAQRSEDMEPLDPARVAHIREELDALGAEETAFCEYLKVDNLMEMPSGRFSDACAALASKRRKIENQKTAEQQPEASS